MDHSKVNRIINQVLLEKSFTEFYKMGESCKGWETNVVTQPAAVKNIVNSGAERIAAGPGVGDQISDDSIAKKIDHTLLKPDSTVDDINELCAEAAKYKFASVCINPCYIPLCRENLKGTGVKVCTVIGFPLGATTTEVKRTEAEQAIANGAEELDMVINVGKLKSGDYDYVFNDIQQVVLPAKKVRALVKVIIETSLLTDEEKIKACIIAKDAGATFVKTSTGFSKGGATAGDVALMKYVVGSTVGVKASGGIRSKEDADAMIESGADRIGASASVKIVTGGDGSGEGY